jgi:hypothetical protein
MSWTAISEPTCISCDEAGVTRIIDGRRRDLGGFTVRRVLPAAGQQMIGPFIFLDEMGPARFSPGQGIDVRPHPHINLATITYLFEGEILHRDSLGSCQPIRPGAINLMTAGRGIVHSERTSPALRAAGSQLHGIQLWLALPRAHEETEPAFSHHPADTLPAIDLDGVRLRLLAGRAYGRTAPVPTFSHLFYADAQLPAGSRLVLPAEPPERAAYLVEGRLHCGEQALHAGQMAVFSPGPIALHADSDARLILLGGQALDGPRHMSWNFVSSSPQRIETARRDWQERRFPLVPGDEVEFIPLPD